MTRDHAAAGITDQEAAAALILDATLALYRFEDSWPQLADATNPNRERRPGAGPTTPRQRRAADAQVLLDKQAAFHARVNRRVPSMDRPAPAVVGAVSVRAQVAGDVARLADRLWVAYTTRRPEWPVFDHTRVMLADRCPDCGGTGRAARPRWYPTGQEWPPRPAGLIGPVDLPQCGRCVAGVVHTIATVTATDQLVYAAVQVLHKLLPLCVDSPERAADAARTIDRADRACRDGAGRGEDRRVLAVPCPVCDARGSLYAEVSAADRRAWLIRCGSPACTCAGRSCPCGRPVRWPGRRHVWPATEWHAPGGLSELLGVDLPPLLDADGQPVPAPTAA